MTSVITVYTSLDLLCFWSRRHWESHSLAAGDDLSIPPSPEINKTGTNFVTKVKKQILE
jgi:hypothetical protein